jgi:hypothetical protein
VKISSGELLPKEDCSRSNLSVALCLLLKIVASLEEFLGNSSSFEGDLFCVVGYSRQDPHLR